MTDGNVDGTRNTIYSLPDVARLADYRPPDFLIDHVELVFDIREQEVVTRSRLWVRRSPGSDFRTPLWLDGESLRLDALTLDGMPVENNAYVLQPGGLLIPSVPDSFVLEVACTIEGPATEGPLGLTRAPDAIYTHCEPQAFRRLTYYPDRPDLLAPFSTTIIADQACYPVLLSNGNPGGHGTLDKERHWVRWDDPHPKPSYLFALAAGSLVAQRDVFVTRSRRSVDLAIWAQPGPEDRCAFAIRALKAAMRWDEEAYGFHYDLDVLNVVALPEFGMGAMENKGLLIFDAGTILTCLETATDQDLRDIQTAIAHEYFHNWTGNRVTIRDWFQLALKEGLTVFRTREFMRNHGDEAAMRVAEVRDLRAVLAAAPDRALRPKSCADIGNLFVPHVYDQGAEVIRMIGQVTGADALRAGIAGFVRNHDGRGTTVEDFLGAVEEPAGMDLSGFLRWYDQGGMPELAVTESYDEDERSHRLTLEQVVPGHPDAAPLVIPVAVGLLDESGSPLPARFEGEPEGMPLTRTLILTERRHDFRFTDVTAPPIVSLLRGASAPVGVRGRSLQQLRFLAAHDADRLARWDAWQQVAMMLLLDLARTYRRDEPLVLDHDFAASFLSILERSPADPEYAAEMLTLPADAAIADEASVIDIEAIHAARSFAREELSRRFRSGLLSAYRDMSRAEDGDLAAQRKLKNVCLDILAAAADDEVVALARSQFRGGNMTDTLAALQTLIEVGGPSGQAALEMFYETWRHKPPLVDKWFAAQARSARRGTAAAMAELTCHPAFDVHLTSRVNALVLTFATENPWRFHASDGSGYSYLVERITEVDALNAAVASRLTATLGSWGRYDRSRQAKMRAALESILTEPGLSPAVREVARENLGETKARRSPEGMVQPACARIG